MTFTLLHFSSGYGSRLIFKGRVVDEDNKPLQGALVKLFIADTSQTTDWDGRFSIDLTSTHALAPGRTVPYPISFHQGILSLRASGHRQRIHVEVFDTRGRRVSGVAQEVTGEETFRSRILPEVLPEAIYHVRLRIGYSTSLFRLMNLKNRCFTIKRQAICSEKSMLEQSSSGARHIDTVEISKDEYKTTTMGISSYATELPAIVLQNTVEEGLPPVVNGKRARTTRYWDCCKPHCGWHSNMRMCDIQGNDLNDRNAQSGCSGGPSFQCMDYAPIEINSKVSYGWAAFNNGGTQCGDCFQLDFQGGLSGKQMIVQVINIGDGGTDAFDLLIPGGGVGALNGCSRQWNNAPLGVQYGGFHSSCGNNAECIRGMCQAAFGNKADLMRGCEWYINWFKMTSNPEVMYAKVSCPQEIKNISRIGN